MPSIRSYQVHMWFVLKQLIESQKNVSAKISSEQKRLPPLLQNFSLKVSPRDYVSQRFFFGNSKIYIYLITHGLQIDAPCICYGNFRLIWLVKGKGYYSNHMMKNIITDHHDV